MSLIRIVGGAAVIATVFVTSAFAQKTPRSCAIVAVFDAAGAFDESLIRNSACDAGSLLAVTVCSADTAKEHTVTISKSMLHKKKRKTYDILADDVTVNVGKAMSDTMPVCASVGVFLAPESDFDDSNLAKKQHGTYRYNGTEDRSKFDPDLDVSPPSGILNTVRKKH